MVKALPNRQPLTEGYLRTVRVREEPFLVWDTDQPGLCVRVRPTGVVSFKVAYRHQGRLRWYTIGRYRKIGLREARDIARQINAKVALGEDPQGDKIQGREGDTLDDLNKRYAQWVRTRNKSWKQGDRLRQVYVLPKLGRRQGKDVARADMWRIFDDLSNRPVLANSVMAAASGLFSWAVKRGEIPVNPCRGIERHKTQSSKRFLSNEEIRLVWPLLDDLGLYNSTKLKLITLTAQRPGEVSHMRWEHLDLEAGLWSMPGAPSEGWPGTKNNRDHEVPLTEPALVLLRDLETDVSKIPGNVFPSTQRPTTGTIHKQLGIPPFRAHDLRATAASGLDALGVSREHISLVLNHVQGGVTAGYIRHDKRAHKRAALEAWAEELTAILTGTGRTDRKAEVIPLAGRAG